MAYRAPTGDEEALRRHLKEESPKRVYFFYGEERYLSAHYTRQVIQKVTGGEDLGGFNCQFFEQDVTLGALEDAVEALPLMAEQKCVVVRDLDAAAAGDRLLTLVADVPESCVLLFYCESLEPDTKKAGWRKFIEAVDKNGLAFECGRKPDNEVVRLLTTGAIRRGATLNGTKAQFLLERVGNDLYRLNNELDKLAAIANGGEITRELIETAAVHTLEASVFRLSDAILAGDAPRGFAILHALKVAREEPIAVAATLANTYADLYRARVMTREKLSQEEIIRAFGYKGKEFRLRNAVRDERKLSDEALLCSVDLLAACDTAMKSSAADKWLLLEQLTVQLIGLTARR